MPKVVALLSDGSRAVLRGESIEDVFRRAAGEPGRWLFLECDPAFLLHPLHGRGYARSVVNVDHILRISEEVRAEE